MKKVLLINGSPNAKGCTYTALTEVASTLEAEGIETELIHVGHKDIRGCIGCRKCEKNCPSGAITVQGGAAHINYELCTSCGTCAEQCPRGCIVKW